MLANKLIVLDSNSFKTLSLRKEDVDKKWLLVDATDQNLGRMCSNIAKILRGKHKPSFTPHVDCGDYIVVINAKKVNLTGNTWENKRIHNNVMLHGHLFHGPLPSARQADHVYTLYLLPYQSEGVEPPRTAYTLPWARWAGG